ncbi:glycosyltransferase family 2 protein [Nocardioides sp.]|uniref:glycosyltransferase family 2 protein n=1 Tax=Nocardioides sp. TaxID=35761 RepID=UPI0035647B80
MSGPLITVFTPTYNRAHTLPRLFASLGQQTMTSFEWLVVDDGSTDGTEEVMERLAAEATFPVRYVKQSNGGKHAATNRGVREAAGELFLTLDSDDWLLPESLERFAHHWASVPDQSRFAAVTGLCQTPEGEVLGSRFPQPVVDSNSLEIRYRHGVTGDKFGFTRTDVMRQFPFPEGEHDYVPEGIVWNAIAGRYLTRYVDEPLQVKDYQADGFTTGGRAVGAEGMALYYRELIPVALPYLWRQPKELLVSASNYSRFALVAGESAWGAVARMQGLLPRLVVVLTLPLGWLRARRQVKRQASSGA